MKREHNVCLELKNWFESYNIDVWLNEGDNKFTTKLTQKKPDMIIYSKILKQYIAIEVKKGDISKEIYDASKILDYWEKYCNNNIEYYINNKKILINSFCVASLGSIFGKIFISDKNKKNINDDKSSWKKVCLNYRIEPIWEYEKTHQYLRNLWANWRRIRNKKHAGVGIIVSNILNINNVKNNNLILEPLLFDMQYKSKWTVQNKVLGVK